MSAPLATAIYVFGIIGLFYLNRDKSIQTSRGLWIPVIWLWITGSRAVSVWFGLGAVGEGAVVNQMTEGSPIDALIFGVLLISGCFVLARRGRRSGLLVKRNWPVILYFAYCLMSVGWSDFPEISLKRWIKAVGDPVMALVVFTDAQPVMAFRRLLSRVGFVLFPMSLLFIKYYPHLGRNHDVWTGVMFNTGVNTDKNMLGVTTYILTLGALWQVRRIKEEAHPQKRFRQLLAQYSLLGLGIWILSLANSATSIACFTLGCMVMLVTGFPRFRRTTAVHRFVVVLMLLGFLIKVTDAEAAVAYALGRNPDLTGRASEIWPLLIPMAPNALVGAGFESFWLGPRLQRAWSAFPGLYLNEAHNGYLELYLNLGIVGLILAILILAHGYRRCVAGFRTDPNLARCMLAYVLTIAIYSYTEAGFRFLSYPCSFLFLVTFGACRLSTNGVLIISTPGAPGKGAHHPNEWGVLVSS
jgi:O-antigen ligase